MARTKRQPLPLHREDKWLKTTEDWKPSFAGSVRATLLERVPGGWRVAVWGGDEFGLEKEFPAGSEGFRAAQQLFDSLVDNTSQADMTQLGMHPA